MQLQMLLCSNPHNNNHKGNNRRLPAGLGARGTAHASPLVC